MLGDMPTFAVYYLKDSAALQTLYFCHPCVRESDHANSLDDTAAYHRYCQGHITEHISHMLCQGLNPVPAKSFCNFIVITKQSP